MDGARWRGSAACVAPVFSAEAAPGERHTPGAPQGATAVDCDDAVEGEGS